VSLSRAGEGRTLPDPSIAAAVLGLNPALLRLGLLDPLRWRRVGTGHINAVRRYGHGNICNNAWVESVSKALGSGQQKTEGQHQLFEVCSPTVA